MEVFPHELFCQHLVTLKATLSMPGNSSLSWQSLAQTPLVQAEPAVPHMIFSVSRLTPVPVSPQRIFKHGLTRSSCPRAFYRLCTYSQLWLPKTRKHLHCTVTDMKMLLSSSGIWQQVGSLIPVELLCHSRFTEVHEIHVKMLVEKLPHLLPS